MKITYNFKSLVMVIVITLYSAIAQAKTIEPAPNGIELPKAYKYWRIIGVSHREDNNSLRAILGNNTAIKAAEKGHTNPWPDGTILAKLVWKDSKHPKWASATVPGELIHAEFMIKDSSKYSSTKGWGFARWKGMQQIPYGKDATFAKECFDCHTTTKDTDYVFTIPAPIP